MKIIVYHNDVQYEEHRKSDPQAFEDKNCCVDVLYVDVVEWKRLSCYLFRFVFGKTLPGKTTYREDN
jgi:hypothetical protein